MLRNLEAKLGGLVEGAFGRAFKSRVQPVELAHKLAKEMEDNQVVSVSRVYVPNHYRVFLSPQDREQFESYEPALRKELSDYLLEHARAEGLALTSRPQIDLETDDRLSLGEFGIQAQLLAPPEEEAPLPNPPENPLRVSPEHEEKSSQRAYHLWEADGRPHGRDAAVPEHAVQPAASRSGPGPTPRTALIVGWAGMRGVVTLAIALALPEDFPSRDTLLLASFAVILFTVVVQGTTLGPLIGLLRIDGTGQSDSEPMNEAAARAAVNHVALAAIEAMVGADGPLHPQLTAEYRIRANATARLRDNPEEVNRRRVEHFAAALAATAAGRAELIRLHRDGQIHESVLNVLEEEFDLEELRLRRLGKLASGDGAAHGAA